MYSVLIVDDEYIIRQGLKKLINWEELGFVIVGEADNAHSAEELALKFNPDLLLLDIRMPGNDGLSLLKSLRHQGIKSKVIFLTGFAEFEYAKKAIPLDVEAFLTKPIDEEELFEHLSVIKEKLDKASHIEIQLNRQEMLERLRQYRHLLMGLKSSSILKMHDQATHCVVEVQYKDTIDQVSGVIDQYQKKHQEVIALLVAESWVIIYKNLNKKQIKTALKQLTSELKLGLDQPFFISAGRIVEGYLDIHLSFSDAKKIGQRWYLSDEETCTWYEECVIKEEQVLYFDNETVFDFIEVNNHDALSQYLTAFKSSVSTMTISFESLKGLLAQNMFIIIERFSHHYPNIKISLPSNREIGEKLYKASHINLIFDLMFEVFMDLMNAIHSGSKESTIYRVLDYIKHHYHQEITLDKLGGLFGYNSSYLGTIFKHNTGKSFTKYLDGIRLEKAKEILNNNELKVYEVASMVGYKSVDYFYLKFKQAEGMSPKKYQKNHSQKDED
ncbi:MULTISPECIES: response regulator [unclassified Fusibacter]|uniref:response regulator n=1 Tax=unclassified Fusibacter TaxID=2624464 RepID=UPI00101110DC|nr:MULTISPECIES: response regulator [unclassified Fusibacter]MCK8061669.1 response regulator [Fusibacter sp. A2]NPE23853.1 response regulator [Fusibacter sp. A1]RXV58568.1 response regulator [Fusibacter sp. A1]